MVWVSQLGMRFNFLSLVLPIGFGDPYKEKKIAILFYPDESIIKRITL